MSFLATQNRPSTSAPGDGSRTMTITAAPPIHDNDDESPDKPPSDQPIGPLRLRAGPRRPIQRVVWDDAVVDNEGCGRKKSKICCIYHKPRRFDESSDEDSSDSEDESHHHHHHSHNHELESNGQAVRAEGTVTINELEPKSEPNAYEAQPSSKKGKRKAGALYSHAASQIYTDEPRPGS
ncbi:phosphatase inhibitor-domain-containing protein [Mycena floridula]|nr:phosphatase inhibitor-domain-containing protein [Mycena floridula]